MLMAIEILRLYTVVHLLFVECQSLTLEYKLYTFLVHHPIPSI